MDKFRHISGIPQSLFRAILARISRPNKLPIIRVIRTGSPGRHLLGSWVTKASTGARGFAGWHHSGVQRTVRQGKRARRKTVSAQENKAIQDMDHEELLA